MVVNEEFVSAHFPNEDVIGRRIRLVAEGAPGPAPPWFTIVGVAPTIPQRTGPTQDPEPDVVAYLPYVMQPSQVPTLMIRSSAPRAAIISDLREEFRSLDADMPLFNIRTMEEVLARSHWPFRVFGTMFSVFAVIALVLSAVGLYAVTAYPVTQRTQEIGVRMALGAQPQQVRWLILRRSLIHLAIGLTIGIGGAFGVGRLLKSLRACFWPARRATKLDPVVALRYE